MLGPLNPSSSSIASSQNKNEPASSTQLRRPRKSSSSSSSSHLVANGSSFAQRLSQLRLAKDRDQGRRDQGASRLLAPPPSTSYNCTTTSRSGARSRGSFSKSTSPQLLVAAPSDAFRANGNGQRGNVRRSSFSSFVPTSGCSAGPRQRNSETNTRQARPSTPLLRDEGDSCNTRDPDSGDDLRYRLRLIHRRPFCSDGGVSSSGLRVGTSPASSSTSRAVLEEDHEDPEAIEIVLSWSDEDEFRSLGAAEADADTLRRLSDQITDSVVSAALEKSASEAAVSEAAVVAALYAELGDFADEDLESVVCSGRDSSRSPTPSAKPRPPSRHDEGARGFAEGVGNPSGCVVQSAGTDEAQLIEEVDSHRRADVEPSFPQRSEEEEEVDAASSPGPRMSAHCTPATAADLPHSSETTCESNAPTSSCSDSPSPPPTATPIPSPEPEPDSSCSRATVVQELLTTMKAYATSYGAGLLTSYGSNLRTRLRDAWRGRSVFAPFGGPREQEEEDEQGAEHFRPSPSLDVDRRVVDDDESLPDDEEMNLPDDEQESTRVFGARTPEYVSADSAAVSSPGSSRFSSVKSEAAVCQRQARSGGDRSSRRPRVGGLNPASVSQTQRKACLSQTSVRKRGNITDHVNRRTRSAGASTRTSVQRGDHTKSAEGGGAASSSGNEIVRQKLHFSYSSKAELPPSGQTAASASPFLHRCSIAMQHFLDGSSSQTAHKDLHAVDVRGTSTRSGGKKRRNLVRQLSFPSSSEDEEGDHEDSRLGLTPTSRKQSIGPRQARGSTLGSAGSRASSEEGSTFGRHDSSAEKSHNRFMLESALKPRSSTSKAESRSCRQGAVGVNPFDDAGDDAADVDTKHRIRSELSPQTASGGIVAEPSESDGPSEASSQAAQRSDHVVGHTSLLDQTYSFDESSSIVETDISSHPSDDGCHSERDGRVTWNWGKQFQGPVPGDAADLHEQGEDVQIAVARRTSSSRELPGEVDEEELRHRVAAARMREVEHEMRRAWEGGGGAPRDICNGHLDDELISNAFLQNGNASATASGDYIEESEGSMDELNTSSIVETSSDEEMMFGGPDFAAHESMFSTRGYTFHPDLYFRAGASSSDRGRSDGSQHYSHRGGDAASGAAIRSDESEGQMLVVCSGEYSRSESAGVSGGSASKSGTNDRTSASSSSTFAPSSPGGRSTLAPTSSGIFHPSSNGTGGECFSTTSCVGGRETTLLPPVTVGGDHEPALFRGRRTSVLSDDAEKEQVSRPAPETYSYMDVDSMQDAGRTVGCTCMNPGAGAGAADGTPELATAVVTPEVSPLGVSPRRTMPDSDVEDEFQGEQEQKKTAEVRKDTDVQKTDFSLPPRRTTTTTSNAPSAKHQSQTQELPQRGVTTKHQSQSEFDFFSQKMSLRSSCSTISNGVAAPDEREILSSGRISCSQSHPQASAGGGADLARAVTTTSSQAFDFTQHRKKRRGP